MKRSQIRYSLFRCKAGTPALEHQQLFDETYASLIAEEGLTIEDFAVEWDVDKKDPTQIVTGKTARKYNADQSLFNSTGELKD